MTWTVLVLIFGIGPLAFGLVWRWLVPNGSRGEAVGDGPWGYGAGGPRGVRPVRTCSRESTSGPVQCCCGRKGELTTWGST